MFAATISISLLVLWLVSNLHNDSLTFLLMQAEQQFGLSLPQTEHHNRVLSVEPVEATTELSMYGPDGELAMFRVLYSDGGVSDVMSWDDLDPAARIVWEQQQQHHVEPQIKKRTKRRSTQSQRTERRKKAYNAQKTAKSAAKQRAAHTGLKTVAPFGTVTEAAELLASVDADWTQTQKDNESLVAAFPTIPTERRLQLSLQKWREHISAPNINLAACAVCAERIPVKHIRTFAVDNNDIGLPVLRPAVLEFMQTQLVQDPLLPTQLSQLEDGVCNSCNSTN